MTTDIELTATPSRRGDLAVVPPPDDRPDDRLDHEVTGRAGAWRATLTQLARKPVFVLCVLYVLFVVVSALFPGLFAHQDPFATVPTDQFQGPSAHHLFGTDNYGRDMWSRMLHGGHTTIVATLLAIAIGLVFGLGLGVLSGFFGGVVDAAIMRVVDVFLSIPGLLMALTIVTALGYGTLPVAIAVGIGIIPGFARTTRAEVLRVKTLPFVEAARGGGARWGSVLLRHILPNSWGPVAVLCVLDAGVAIVAIASLSFLGFGVQPPAAEWGTLISDGRNYIATEPYLSLLPGLFVAVLVLSLNHISKTLQELER